MDADAKATPPARARVKKKAKKKAKKKREASRPALAKIIAAALADGAKSRGASKGMPRRYLPLLRILEDYRKALAGEYGAFVQASVNDKMVARAILALFE